MILIHGRRLATDLIAPSRLGSIKGVVSLIDQILQISLVTRDVAGYSKADSDMIRHERCRMG